LPGKIVFWKFIHPERPLRLITENVRTRATLTFTVLFVVLPGSRGKKLKNRPRYLIPATPTPTNLWVFLDKKT